MPNAKAFAASSPTSLLSSTSIPRREPTERDVEIDILYCGVCHSDLHQARNEWSAVPTTYPCVPGHEIVGRVTKIGSAVTNHQVGDIVGVGCLVDSDQKCPSCAANLEQFCPHATFTYNSPDKHGTAPVTYGGYSTTDQSPEPFAYETGIAVRWLILAQIVQRETGVIDSIAGDMLTGVPVVTWGAYLWTDGLAGRADGLVWTPADVMGTDGMHPSTSGQSKVANLLMTFFKGSPYTRCWFLAARPAC